MKKQIPMDFDTEFKDHFCNSKKKGSCRAPAKTPILLLRNFFWYALGHFFYSVAMATDKPSLLLYSVHANIRAHGQKDVISIGHRSSRQTFCLAGLSVLLLAAFLISFALGKYPVPLTDLPKVILSKIFAVEKTWSDAAEAVILQIRLPRVLAAMMIGAALSGAGVAYQSLFQNPMVSPDVLGASAGAGFGAAMGITLSLGFMGITLAAFLFGIAAVAVAYFISIRIKQDPAFGMVLAGIMVGSLFTSGISYLKLIADPNDMLPAITYWLMGSLASIRNQDIRFAAVPMLVGLVPLLLLRWRLNVLTMGEEEARSLGIHTGRLRLAVVCCATIATSAGVAISGMIGWVGLVIPHLARHLIGSDNRVLVPASMLLGGSFLLAVDTLARMITTSEIPLGILTSFVGAPFFLFLMLRGRHTA